MDLTARALWISPGSARLHDEHLPAAGADDVVVRTIFSAVSRGTEALVFRGGVPVGQHERMRAPFQAGRFPGPVKYGYLNVGVVEHGPSALLEKTVFCLYPHQTRYLVPADAVTPVPAGVPAGRAVLAGTVETAVNALWDARPLVGDRVCVVGAGMVGGAVARLVRAIPGVRVQLVDVDQARADLARSLGVEFSTPVDAVADCDLVFNTSGSAEGLRRSLELLRIDGTVIDLSWYGDKPVTLPLGEDYHARRLTIRSSQVGTVSEHRAASRSFSDRIRLALDLLTDPAFDALITSECTFDELPAVLPRLASGELSTVCHRVSYPAN